MYITFLLYNIKDLGTPPRVGETRPTSRVTHVPGQKMPPTRSPTLKVPWNYSIDPYASSTSPVDGPAAPSATGDSGEASVTEVDGERGLLGLRNGVLWRDGGRECCRFCCLAAHGVAAC